MNKFYLSFLLCLSACSAPKQTLTIPMPGIIISEFGITDDRLDELLMSIDNTYYIIKLGDVK